MKIKPMKGTAKAMSAWGHRFLRDGEIHLRTHKMKKVYKNTKL